MDMYWIKEVTGRDEHGTTYNDRNIGVTEVGKTAAIAIALSDNFAGKMTDIFEDDKLVARVHVDGGIDHYISGVFCPEGSVN